MDSIKDLLKKSTPSPYNVTNDNKYNIVSNDTHNNNKGDYALDKSTFKPSTPTAYCAIDIAQQLHDTDNFAFFLKVATTVGCQEAYRILSLVKDAMKNSKNPIRKPNKYYAKIYSNLHGKGGEKEAK